MEVRLLIKPKNEGEPQEITLSGGTEFVLGRGPSSAALLDGPGISREHVAVNVDQSQVFAMDLSVNGTWVNGKRLAQHQKHRVEHGDVVEIPGYELVVQVQDAQPQVNSNGSAAPVPEKTIATSPTPPAVPVSSLKASFTLLDCFIMALALLTIVLAIFYVMSY
jgi:pSer/pThr/pTyr-binding forkhead associated (FHA) protein